MRLAIVLALTCIACSRRSALAPEVSEASNDRFRITARAVDTVHGPAIHFTLTYLAPEPLNLYPSRLPWGNPNSTDVSATTATGKQLEGGYPIADSFGQTPFTLRKGHTLEGDFRLEFRISDLSQARRSSDVVVKWRYPLLPFFKGMQPLEGQVVFRRKRTG